MQEVKRYHLHFFCVKFGFIKKGSFFCGKDEKSMYTIERGFLYRVQIEGLPDGAKKVCLRTDAMPNFRYYCSHQSVADNGDLIAEWDAEVTEQMPLAVYHLEVYMEDRSKIWTAERFAQTSNNVISLGDEQ